jgi:hypothetical protein
MHQEEEHETAVNKDVHDPPKKVLPQYSELEQYIQNKDFQQCENLGTENTRDHSFDGRKKPCGS